MQHASRRLTDATQFYVVNMLDGLMLSGNQKENKKTPNDNNTHTEERNTPAQAQHSPKTDNEPSFAHVIT